MLPSVAIALVLAARAPSGDASPLEISFEHSLSSSFGTLPFSDVALSYDREHRELYVAGSGPVRVFNESGMEVYSFGDSPQVAAVRNIAALDDGDLLAFALHTGRLALVRLNFRGEFRNEIVPRNLPQALGGLLPSVMRYAAGKIYLVDMNAMQVVVLDETGEYQTSYDVAEKIGVADKRADLGLRGFNVDQEGNLLFTIQPLFSAYVMTPAGEVRGFGQKGSAPGKFNIVAGISRDDAGFLYVVDILKSAVLVFDAELRFVKEFGYRGGHAGSLRAPEDVVAAGGRLYVSNRARKGVSVFRVVTRER
jgi:DNA-binding beta-propeller fold protein YncE